MLGAVNGRSAAGTCQRGQDTWQSRSPRGNDRTRRVVRAVRPRSSHCSADLAAVVPVRAMLQLHVVPSPSSTETVTLLITLIDGTRDTRLLAGARTCSPLVTRLPPLLSSHCISSPATLLLRSASLLAFCSLYLSSIVPTNRSVDQSDRTNGRITAIRRNGLLVVGRPWVFSVFSFNRDPSSPRKSGSEPVDEDRGAARSGPSGRETSPRWLSRRDAHTRDVYTHEKSPFLLSGLAEPN